MKILNARDKFLSNYEVLTHLQQIKKRNNWSFKPEDERGNKKKRFTACGLDLEVITRDLTSYLEGSATGQITSVEQFTELMKFLNQYELMKIEKLQIVNSLPRSAVTMYAVVEEFDQRFTEDICEAIIGKINELFPLPEEEAEEEAEEEEEGEEEAGADAGAEEDATMET